MHSNSTKILLLITLVGDVLLSVSSNSWLWAWIGLEINLISFIPLMSNVKNMYNTEASLKYFIVQVLASATLLFTVVIKTVFLRRVQGQIGIRLFSFRPIYKLKRREENQLDATESFYCTYNLLNMFRALICPSPGARDYTCVIAAYGV